MHNFMFIYLFVYTQKTNTGNKSAKVLISFFQQRPSTFIIVGLAICGFEFILV